MASLNRETAIQRWVDDIAENNWRRNRSYRGGYPSATTYLWGEETRFVMRLLGQEWVLAELFPERGYVALNGDGIDRWRGAPGTHWQTRVREAVQRHPALRSMVIPFQAIGGAGVDLSTARLIHVLDDGFVDDLHRVPPVPEEVLSGELPAKVIQARGLDGEQPPEQWFAYRKPAWGTRYEYFSSPTPVTALTPPPGSMWQQVVRLSEREWGWTGRRHQLGEALFSAVGEDGRRHKFVSSFDHNENPPLYFLAQLPDGSGANTIEEGVRALAPPIVQRAWEEERHVRRQGDVFFVPTDLSDTNVYALAARRVRRECVLQSIPVRAVGPWPVPVLGEVRSKVDCPCNCGHKRWTSDTPLGRRTLAIYGTAHTASEVVVTKTGTTYVKGMAYHDPQVIGEQRQPDHRVVDLGSKWHLAVRNTVPRRSTPRVLEEVNT